MKWPKHSVKRPRLRRPVRFPAISRPRIPSLRSLVILVVLLAGALAVIRAAGSPIDSTWLGRLVASRIADRLGAGWTVQVDALRLDFTAGPIPTVTIVEARFDLASKGVFIDLPRVSGKPAGSAFFGGSVDLGKVEVERPFVGIERSTTAPPILSGAEFAVLADAGLASAVDALERFGIDEIEVQDAALVINGEAPRSFEAIDLTARLDEKTQTVAVNASVAGRDGRWTVQFRHGQEPNEQGGRWLQLSAADVTVSEFLPVNAPVRAGRGLGLPLFPQLTLLLDSDGTFKRGDLRLGVGGGYFSLQDEDSVLIDEVLMHLSWSADRPQVVLEPSYAVFGDSRVTLHGEIRPPREPGSARWEIALEAPKAWLRPRDVPGPPLVLDSALAFGSFDAANMVLSLDTLSVRAGQASVTGAGSIEFSPDGPLLAMAMSFGAGPVAAYRRLWPSMVSPKARKWVIEHVENGRITGGRLTVGLDRLGFDGDPSTVGWTRDSLLLDFGFEGVSLKGIGDMPELVGIDGTGSISDGAFLVEAGGARAQLPGGGTVEVATGRFEIPDLAPVDKDGILDLSLQGAIGDLARVASLRPVDATAKLGIDPANLSGTGEVAVTVSFPLEKHFDRTAIDWSMVAKLSKFSSSAPIAGQSIKNAELQVTAAKDTAVIRGRGQLNGLMADIDLVQPLLGSGVAASQGVVLDLDTEELAARGIDLAGFVSGKVKVAIRSREDGGRDVEADLTQAELSIGPVGWTKAAGVAANARFVVSENGAGKVVDDFLLTSEGVEIAGGLRIGEDGKFQSATFDTFALRTTDKGKLAVEATAGGYRIRFDAEQFDGRGLLANLKRGGGGDGFAKDLEFTAKIGRMKGFNNIDVTSLAANVTVSDGKVSRATVSGLSNGRASTRLTLQPSGKQRNLVVQMANAGEALGFLGLYNRMKGGKGNLQAQLGDDATATGRIVINDLMISEDSELRKIIGSNPEFMRHGMDRDQGRVALRRIARAGGTPFQKLNIEFTKTADTVRVQEGTLKGAVLGGTVDGTIDLDSQQLNLSGTFVPAYALNNLFGQIPLLGQLVGGRTGGLLGVTFRVSGTLDNPALSVNPMSAIAPGIFRKIFEFR